jgi:hypothetical protein
MDERRDGSPASRLPLQKCLLQERHRACPPSVELSFARYRSQPIFDTMHQWNKWSPRKYVSLDRLAKILGLESSKGAGD